MKKTKIGAIRCLGMTTVIIGILPMVALAEWSAPNMDEIKQRGSLKQASIAVRGSNIDVQVYGPKTALDFTVDDLATVVKSMGELAGGKPPATVKLVVDEQAPFRQFYRKNVAYVGPQPALADAAQAVAYYWWNSEFLGERWMQIGMGRVIALEAMRRSGYGAEAKFAANQQLQPWRDASGQNDEPLVAVDFDELVGDQLRYFEGKALAVGLIVRSVLGDNFGRWLAKGATAKRSGTVAKWIQSVQDQSGKSIEPVLRGWVLKGSYGAYSRANFGDDDDDGLIDLLETVAGSHYKNADSDQDGISDGYEFWAGLDAASNGADAVAADRNAVFIAVDGLINDWQLRNIAPVYVDAQGDGKTVDMRNVYFLANDQHYCVAVDWYSPLPMNHDLRFMVNWRDGAKRTVTVGHDAAAGATWIQRAAKGQLSNNKTAPAGTSVLRDVFETCVERSLLRGDTIQINIAVFDNRAAGTQAHEVDSMKGWWAPVVVREHTSQ